MRAVCKLVDSDDLAEAARSHAERLGFHAVIDNACDDWSYDAAADNLLKRLRELRREHSRVCLISAGEVTVRVDEAAASARGGRNQHFALYMATQLRARGWSDSPCSPLGRMASTATATRRARLWTSTRLIATRLRESALRALAEFDSSSWLSGAGATVVTGPTGHNLRDLRILLADSAD